MPTPIPPCCPALRCYPIKTQVEETVTHALNHRGGAAIGVFGLIFSAVMREGFEPVVFITAKFEQGIIPALGALAGLGVVATIGFLLFKWGVKLNLRLFFQVMGILLLLIVAGLTVTTLAHFDAAVAAIASRLRRKFGYHCDGDGVGG